MEALAISAANLDIIEQNLGTMAKELGGVVSNVSDVNEHVNEVENKVASLNQEVKDLVKDIRENTIITSARQSIMYNNEIIDKKFGYYDNVRRNALSLLDACLHSNIRVNSLIKLRDNILLNNPNYWLANALCALTSWVLNDKVNATKEVQNALNKDASKSSLFFSLVNLKLDRRQTSINWLNKYLSLESPLKLDNSFITVLDLVTSGLYGDDAKRVLFQKIEEWMSILQNEKDLNNKQVDTWYNHILNYKDDEIQMPICDKFCTDISLIENNLSYGSVYEPFGDFIQSILRDDNSNKSIDEVLENLIYEYETKENEFQKDNLLNRLIIDCNGDRDKAMELYRKQEGIYDNKTDLLSLFTNIALYSENYKVSNETKKIALSYVKKYILEALDKINSKIIEHDYQIQVGDFNSSTSDGSNFEMIKKEIEAFLSHQFDAEDKDLLIILIIINIIGIIGIFFTLSNKILCFLIIAILVIGNIVLFSRLGNRNKVRNYEKDKMRDYLYNSIDLTLAEIFNYHRILSNDKHNYESLVTSLNNLNVANYINSNGERNIDVGE
mgnify:CR=1 FL=1